jgi:amino acid transporter
MVAALLTALSYASLSSRYPRAGGAAYVTQRAYGRPLLSFVTGFAVVASALTSIATQSRVFAENVRALLGIEHLASWVLALGFLLVLGGLVFRGIRESMWVNVVCTLFEAAGLLLIIAVALPFWGSVNLLETPTTSGASFELVLLSFQGAVLTFFAFIGFEDSFNVAEECRDPRRTLPIGLLSAMGIGALLYIAVAISAVSVVPWNVLSGEPAPLAAVIDRAAPAIPPALLTGITLFAVANTALVNYVTASRLVYGMSRQGLLPELLGRVHLRRQTPHVAIFVLLLILLPLAGLGDIGDLAAATVLMLLGVFVVVNGALFVLATRKGEPRGLFEITRLIPALGAVVCSSLIAVRIASGDWGAVAIAGLMLIGIVGLYFLVPTRVVPSADPLD